MVTSQIRPILKKASLSNPPRLMSLADLTPHQINFIVSYSQRLRRISRNVLTPTPLEARHNSWHEADKARLLRARFTPPQSLRGMSIAMLFSKRSTRTRVAAETASKLLGGQALFLGKDDIQLGVNESARDTARVLSGMCQGIFARVGDHEEIEELAKYAKVPVLNALSSLWHPTQVLADIMTIYDEHSFWTKQEPENKTAPMYERVRPLTVAYVGDSANVLHDMLVTYPRLGHNLRVATPLKYRAPQPVMDKVKELRCDKGILWTEDPREAVHGADVVVTDTWISMGQEAETEQRLKDFSGYQVTEALCKEGGAKEDWKFLHCLPRKAHEVDDEVFYGPRSLVFQEADNRKWTIMALFHFMFGNWTLTSPKVIERSAPPSTPERQEDI